MVSANRGGEQDNQKDEGASDHSNEGMISETEAFRALAVWLSIDEDIQNSSVGQGRASGSKDRSKKSMKSSIDISKVISERYLAYIEGIPDHLRDQML